MFLKPKRGGKGRGGGGGNGGAQQSRHIQTTQGLKEDLQKYEKRRDFLEKKSRNELAKAKGLTKQNQKQAAILHLKKKKLYDNEVQKLDSAILTIEQQVIDIESGHLNLDIINTQERGVAEMERLRRQLDPERIENIIDNMTEQTDNMQEINEMLIENGIVDMEDPDILEELDNLMLDDMEDKLEEEEIGLPPAISVQNDDEAMAELLELQDAPDTKPIVEKDVAVAVGGSSEDDDAFKELATEMGI